MKPNMGDTIGLALLAAAMLIFLWVDVKMWVEVATFAGGATLSGILHSRWVR